MATVLARVFPWKNVSHVSRFMTSQLTSFSTKIAVSSERWRPVTKIQLLTPRYRCYSETNRSKSEKISILSMLEDDKKNEEEEEKIREEERQKQRKYMKVSFISFGALIGAAGAYFIYEYSGPAIDEQGNVIADEFTDLPFFEQRIKRMIRELTYFRKYVQEPSREKLLPDPFKFPYIQPPYTVVLEMKDVLVHPDWTYQTGWRFKKRPGVDQFLEAVAPPQFETVIYTADPGTTVFPILDALDPHQYIMFRLVRDSTRFVDGAHVKDLDAINRDLSKVIMIDWNEESVKFHPDNLLKIPRWTGNDDDTSLLDLAAFLKTIYATNVEDVRDVLRHYKQFDNPLEAFRENQRKLMEQIEEEKNRKQQQQQNKFTSGTTWKPSFLKSQM